MKISFTYLKHSIAPISKKAGTVVLWFLLVIMISKISFASVPLNDHPANSIGADYTLPALKSPPPPPACGGCTSVITYTNSYEATIVDGNDAEWNLAADFWSGMYNAGKSTFE